MKIPMKIYYESWVDRLKGNAKAKFDADKFIEQILKEQENKRK